MVSTVTVGSIAAIEALGFATRMAAFVTVALFLFITSKVALGATVGGRRKLLARSLDVGIIPLLVAFAVVVGFKVAEILAG